MSIADKLTTIAENEPKVYEAGKQSMVDPNKIVKQTIVGEGLVFANDVSEIPHSVEVKLSSDTITNFSTVKVKKYGTNLATAQQVYNSYNWTGMGIYYEELVEDERNCIRFVDCAQLQYTGIEFKENTQYTISSWYKRKLRDGQTTTDTVNIPMRIWYTDGTTGDIALNTINAPLDEWVHKTFTTAANKTISAIGVASYTWHTWLYIDVDTFQIEEGRSPTKYTPYKEPEEFTANADGTVEGITSTSPNLTLQTDAESINISMTYNKSYGMQTEYDRFWDSYQSLGDRSTYAYAFMNVGWNRQIFKPKYDMYLTANNAQMFSWTGIDDLKGILEELGIVLDTSNATGLTSIFYYSQAITHIPVISCVSTTNMQTAFAYTPKLHTIEKLILKEDGTNTFYNTFLGATVLANIVIEGVIGTNISFQSSPLTVESMNSIISCLKDYSSAGGTYTLTFKADRETMLTDEEKVVATNKGWTLVWS